MAARSNKLTKEFLKKFIEDLEEEETILINRIKQIETAKDMACAVYENLQLYNGDDINK